MALTEVPLSSDGSDPSGIMNNNIDCSSGTPEYFVVKSRVQGLSCSKVLLIIFIILECVRHVQHGSEHLQHHDLLNRIFTDL